MMIHTIMLLGHVAIAKHENIDCYGYESVFYRKRNKAVN